MRFDRTCDRQQRVGEVLLDFGGRQIETQRDFGDREIVHTVMNEDIALQVRKRGDRRAIATTDINRAISGPRTAKRQCRANMCGHGANAHEHSAEA